MGVANDVRRRALTRVDALGVNGALVAQTACIFLPA